MQSKEAYINIHPNNQKGQIIKLNQQEKGSLTIQENVQQISCDSEDEQTNNISVQQHNSIAQQLIVDPTQFLNYCLSNKKIKIMNQQNVIFPNVYLKDISLHYKGPMQDKAYSKNYQYYINIRRGNTLCQIYQQQANKDNYQLFFCRRGMKKFYDLQKQYLATEYSSKLTTQHLKYRRRIFEKIDQVNFNQSKVHLYSIFKQNGQHCQITFVKKLNCWLFASKNVSILVRDQSDLQNYYQKIRFYWAKLIAKQFLKMVQKLSPNQIKQLKQQLDTKTLLGQHCGYEQHQHITKYDKVQIIFYGIVQKIGQDHCMSVDYCREFLKKYNFKMSTIKEVRDLKDKNSVYQNMYSLLKQTAEGTMNQYGEGSVLYVVQQKLHEPKSQRTIAMCKLKTSQYLIFRRLREMLKLNVQRKSTANTYEKFKFDIQNLLEHYFKPPKSLDFYLKVGKQAFRQASKDSNVTQTYLRYKFVEFMQRIQIKQKKLQQNEQQKGRLNKKVLVICLPRLTNKLQKYAKNNAINLEYMYRNLPQQKNSEFIPSFHILHMIPRLPQDIQSLSKLQIFIYQYNEKQIQTIQKQLSHYKDISKSHLITFIKSEDKRKSLELLNDKIQSLVESLKNKNIKFNLISSEVEDKDQAVIKMIQKLRCKSQCIQQGVQNQIPHKQGANQATKNKIIVIHSLLLPGSGKSSLCKQLQKIFNQSKSIKFYSITIDQIRKKHIQNSYNQKGIKIDVQDGKYRQIFSQVRQVSYSQYQRKFQQIIQKHRNSSQKHKAVLFLDKVFGLDQIEQQIRKISSKYKDIIIPLILIPSSNQLKIKDYVFPFSLQYLLICLKRCIQRSDHETMTTLPQQICSIFLWYLKFYNNFSYKKLQMLLSQVNPQTKIYKIQTVKQNQLPMHNMLKKQFLQCLQSGNNKDKNMELIQLIYKNSDQYLKDIYVQQNRNDGAQNLNEILTKMLNK